MREETQREREREIERERERWVAFKTSIVTKAQSGKLTQELLLKT